jgi:hypothetical protein
VKNINIKAVCNQSDGFASVENNTSDGVILGYGSTDVTIKVEASDRSFSIYTITVFRPTGKSI